MTGSNARIDAESEPVPGHESKMKALALALVEYRWYSCLLSVVNCVQPPTENIRLQREKSRHIQPLEKVWTMIRCLELLVPLDIVA